MLQDFTKAGRFCPDCGMDVSVICPTCHGLGTIQPLPTLPSFTVAICDHAGELGEYCTKCGAKMRPEPMTQACPICMGKGWVNSTTHYCMKKFGISPQR